MPKMGCSNPAWPHPYPATPHCTHADEVATALHYLHSHGIVHGDLSAWNVLLTSTGPGAAEGSRGFTAKVSPGPPSFMGCVF